MENKNRHEHDSEERRTVGYLKNQVGRTILIMNSFYVIENEDNQTQRVAPENLPQELKKDGLRILYSGEVKEIYPHERMAGHPFKLINFEILE